MAPVMHVISLPLQDLLERITKLCKTDRRTAQQNTELCNFQDKHFDNFLEDRMHVHDDLIRAEEITNTPNKHITAQRRNEQDMAKRLEAGTCSEQ